MLVLEPREQLRFNLIYDNLNGPGLGVNPFLGLMELDSLVRGSRFMFRGGWLALEIKNVLEGPDSCYLRFSDRGIGLGPGGSGSAGLVLGA